MATQEHEHEQDPDRFGAAGQAAEWDARYGERGDTSLLGGSELRGVSLHFVAAGNEVGERCRCRDFGRIGHQKNSGDFARVRGPARMVPRHRQQ